MKLADSPITEHNFNGHPFYLKRDDLLHPEFSGNKARKFMALLETDSPNVTTLIGYGSPQANSLYSLAALAKLKSWTLEFYVSHIPNWLKQNPIGNYQAALELGAQIIDISQLETELSPHDYIERIRKPNEQCIFVPEGGRSPIAEFGIKQLAEEILCWVQEENIKALTVALPSGTGTTALYLHKHLALHNIHVLTCACVGGKDYLIKQFESLGEAEHPHILTSLEKSKHQFGKLYAADYQMWQSLTQQTQVEFDLLYDPYMWQCLAPYLAQWRESHSNQTLLYIHQGGLLGNTSMAKRYQRKYSL
ncbi:1-aminocyclopropane-1-carboxylate deaminase/D-cysteine desulfhydrase [Vibrio rumoiensis]|uniref:1-aminocyclopropane-1-carboxylate deaminase n=1 Tax=Vibrio rumoiensis 1S-45 TaxID=1188252 RepID=A0A1E5E3W4_9VIBR|nr:1-aminocyclopropane-1-carboxylate deaminase/D-cysteine desulfhydrase [Vibrio rumoiensis]OEF27274.1 1-aminocyclopropane-1-carboxylate deaminase [Vibrio rumoiensis 1S-45]